MTDDIKQYIWDSLDDFKHLFPDSVIKKLQSLKKHKSQSDFFEQLEIVFDLEPSKFIQIQEFYTEYICNSSDSIFSLTKLLHESFKIDFKTKIEFIEKAETLIRSSKEDTLELAILCENLANLYITISNYQSAETLLNKVLTIRLKIIGENHPDTAKCYNKLGYICDFNQKHDIGKEYFKKALEIQLNTLGDTHPTTATIYCGFGHLYDSLEDYQKAKEYYLLSLDILSRITDAEFDQVIALANQGLGSIYLSIKDYHKSKEYFEIALNIRLKIFGEYHPDTAKSFHGLGYVYDSLREYDKAIEYLQKALNIRLYTLGEYNLNTAWAYYGLGHVYTSLAKYQIAKENFESAIRILSTTLGENHAETAWAYYGLGHLYDALQEYEKAIEFFEKTLHIRRQISGENHQNTMSVYNDLGVIYSKLKNEHEAKKYFNKVFTTSLEKLGISHSDTVLYYSNLIESARNLNETFFVNTKTANIESILQSIQILNFKLLEDINIEFTKNINIIIGENSSGKTSLLQAITLGLLEENYVGESNYKYEKYISKNNNEAKLKLITSQNYIKEVTIQKDKRIITNKIFSPFVLAYCSNIFSKEAIEVDDFVNDMIDGKIRKDFSDSIFEDYTNQYYNPKSILNKLLQLENPLAQEFELIITTIINDFLGDFNLIKGLDNRYYFQHNTKDYRLQELSEGYRNTIVLIGDITVKILGTGQRPKTVEGIILIDEFDRHLHPKIQTNLVSKLAKHFPNIQFILTTHNPMAVLDRKQEEIIVLFDKDGKIEAKKGIGTESIDVGTVLLQYFGVDSLVGKTMQDNIERSIELQIKDDLTQDETDELDRLKTLLNNTVATNFIYNKAYYNFLHFLKKHPKLEYQEFKKFDDIQMTQLMEKWKDIND